MLLNNSLKINVIFVHLTGIYFST